MEYFDTLDVEQTGTLSIGQLMTPVMQLTGLDEDEARQFITTLDFNKDGVIDKQEFMDMWTLMFE